MKKWMQDRQIHAPGPNQHPNAAGSGGGLPWGKILIGCGCLGFLALIALLVAVYFAVDAGSKFLDETGVSDIVQMAEEADNRQASNSGEGAGSEDIQQQARERKEQALDPEKIRGYIDQPLTKKDIREHHAFIEKWQDNPAHKDWLVQYEKMKELGKQKDDSVAGGLKKVGQSAKWVNAARHVMEAFDKHVRDSGGYETYYSRMMRIGGVVAASDTIAKSNKELDNADSDAVAERIIEERPEIAKQYEKNLAEAKEAAANLEKRKKAGEDPTPGDMAAFSGLATIMQGPGTIALARMPEESFETWKDLSVDERKKLRESLTTSIAPGHWFGMYSVNPAGLIMTAYMAEMDELRSK